MASSNMQNAEILERACAEVVEVETALIREINMRFVPLSRAHELMGYHEQYARRVILAHALPGRDTFTLWGRTLVSIAFVQELMQERTTC